MHHLFGDFISWHTLRGISPSRNCNVKVFYTPPYHIFVALEALTPHFWFVRPIKFGADAQMSVFLYKGTKNNLKTLNSHVSGTLPGLSSANASSVFETASSVRYSCLISVSQSCTAHFGSCAVFTCVILTFSPLNSLNMCCWLLEGLLAKLWICLLTNYATEMFSWCPPAFHFQKNRLQ